MGPAVTSYLAESCSRRLASQPESSKTPSLASLSATALFALCQKRRSERAGNLGQNAMEKVTDIIQLDSSSCHDGSANNLNSAGCPGGKQNTSDGRTAVRLETVRRNNGRNLLDKSHSIRSNGHLDLTNNRALINNSGVSLTGVSLTLCSNESIHLCDSNISKDNVRESCVSKERIDSVLLIDSECEHIGKSFSTDRPVQLDRLVSNISSPAMSTTSDNQVLAKCIQLNDESLNDGNRCVETFDQSLDINQSCSDSLAIDKEKTALTSKSVFPIDSCLPQTLSIMASQMSNSVSQIENSVSAQIENSVSVNSNSCFDAKICEQSIIELVNSRQNRLESKAKNLLARVRRIQCRKADSMHRRHLEGLLTAINCQQKFKSRELNEKDLKSFIKSEADSGAVQHVTKCDVFDTSSTEFSSIELDRTNISELDRTKVIESVRSNSSESKRNTSRYSDLNWINASDRVSTSISNTALSTTTSQSSLKAADMKKMTTSNLVLLVHRLQSTGARGNMESLVAKHSVDPPPTSESQMFSTSSLGVEKNSCIGANLQAEAKSHLEANSHIEMNSNVLEVETNMRLHSDVEQLNHLEPKVSSVQSRSLTKAATGGWLDEAVRDEVLEVVDHLEQNLRSLEYAADSDATESSSGSEDEREERECIMRKLHHSNERSNEASVLHPIHYTRSHALLDSDVASESPDGSSYTRTLAQRNATLRWLRDRAAVACRWTWLQAQVSDLEYRIRRQNDICERLRALKRPLVFDEPTHTASLCEQNRSCRTTKNYSTLTPISSAKEDVRDSIHSIPTDSDRGLPESKRIKTEHEIDRNLLQLASNHAKSSFNGVIGNKGASRSLASNISTNSAIGCSSSLDYNSTRSTPETDDSCRKTPNEVLPLECSGYSIVTNKIELINSLNQSCQNYGSACSQSAIGLQSIDQSRNSNNEERNQSDCSLQPVNQLCVSYASMNNQSISLQSIDQSCRAARCIPVKSWRKRSLVRVLGLHRRSRKAAALSTVRCTCVHGAGGCCAICTGRHDYSRRPGDTEGGNRIPRLSKSEALSVQDQSYHPVLSFSTDVSVVQRLAESMHRHSDARNHMEYRDVEIRPRIVRPRAVHSVQTLHRADGEVAGSSWSSSSTDTAESVPLDMAGGQRRQRTTSYRSTYPSVCLSSAMSPRDVTGRKNSFSTSHIDTSRTSTNSSHGLKSSNPMPGQIARRSVSGIGGRGIRLQSSVSEATFGGQNLGLSARRQSSVIAAVGSSSCYAQDSSLAAARRQSNATRFSRNNGTISARRQSSSRENKHDFSAARRQSSATCARRQSSSTGNLRDHGIPARRQSSATAAAGSASCGNSAFDINNIVIPCHVTAVPSRCLEALQYKEIITPKWRLAEQPIGRGRISDRRHSSLSLSSTSTTASSFGASFSIVAPDTKVDATKFDTTKVDATAAHIAVSAFAAKPISSIDTVAEVTANSDEVALATATSSDAAASICGRYAAATDTDTTRAMIDAAAQPCPTITTRRRSALDHRPSYAETTILHAQVGGDPNRMEVKSVNDGQVTGIQSDIEEIEDLSDEAFAARHLRYEIYEKKLHHPDNLIGGGSGRGRGRRRSRSNRSETDSLSASYRGHLPQSPVFTSTTPAGIDEFSRSAFPYLTDDSGSTFSHSPVATATDSVELEQFSHSPFSGLANDSRSGTRRRGRPPRSSNRGETDSLNTYGAQVQSSSFVTSTNSFGVNQSFCSEFPCLTDDSRNGLSALSDDSKSEFAYGNANQSFKINENQSMQIKANLKSNSVNNFEQNVGTTLASISANQTSSVGRTRNKIMQVIVTENEDFMVEHDHDSPNFDSLSSSCFEVRGLEAISSSNDDVSNQPSLEPATRSSCRYEGNTDSSKRNESTSNENIETSCKSSGNSSKDIEGKNSKITEKSISDSGHSSLTNCDSSSTAHELLIEGVMQRTCKIIEERSSSSLNKNKLVQDGGTPNSGNRFQRGVTNAWFKEDVTSGAINRLDSSTLDSCERIEESGVPNTSEKLKESSRSLAEQCVNTSQPKLMDADEYDSATESSSSVPDDSESEERCDWTMVQQGGSYEPEGGGKGRL